MISPSVYEPRWMLGAFLLAILSYLPALSNGLVWDDIHLINSDIVNGTSTIWTTFLGDYWNLGRIWTDSGGYYRPLTVVSLRIDYLLGHGSPLFFHATNLLLHGIATVAVYPVARRFGAPAIVARCSAVLFAVHPHQTETIAWVSGRPDLLMTATLLWALALSGPTSWILGACSLLSKETAVVWPLLAALRDRQLFNTSRYMQCVLVASYLLIRSLALDGTPSRLVGLDLATGVRALFLTIGSWIWPWGAPFVYTPITSWSASPLVLWIGAFICVALLILVSTRPETRRYFFASALVHAPVALIMSSLAMIGLRPLYAASAFLTIGLVTALPSRAFALISKHPRWFLAGAVVLAVSSGATSTRWSNDLSFQERAAAAAPSSAMVRVNLAVAQRDNGRLEECYATTRWQGAQSHEGLSYIRAQLLETIGCPNNAASAYREAIRINAHFGPAYNALSQMLFLRGEEAQASAVVAEAATFGIIIPNRLAVQPSTTDSTMTTPTAPCSEEEISSRFADAKKLLVDGNRWLSLRRTDLAEVAIRASMRIAPPSPTALLALAQVLYLTHKFPEAIERARSVLTIAPDAVPALKILGLSLIDSGIDVSEGRSALRLYLELTPNSGDRAYLEERYLRER